MAWKSMLDIAKLALFELEARTPLSPDMEAPVEEADICLWLLQHCVYRDGSWTSVATLHSDYAEWRSEQGRPTPIARHKFEEALDLEGFWRNDNFVYGLLLSADLCCLRVVDN